MRAGGKLSNQLASAWESHVNLLSILWKITGSLHHIRAGVGSLQAMQVCAHCPYQDTNHALSRLSPASILMFWPPSVTHVLSYTTAFLRLTRLTSFPYTSVPCPVYPYIFPQFFPRPANCHFWGVSYTPVLASTGLLAGHKRAQHFNSIPLQANDKWGPLIHFLPASRIIQTNYFASPAFTLLSCQLIQLWTQNLLCSSHTSADFQQTTWHYISEDNILQTSGNYKNARK